MRGVISCLLIVLAGVLSGCAAPLAKITYDKPASVTSERTATLSYSSGTAAGYTSPVTVPVSGMFVTVPGRSAPAWSTFNAQDQSLFVGNLKEELDRLGIVKIADPGSSRSADIDLKIHFERTTKGPSNDYELLVRLAIEMPGGNIARTYRLRSFEGESAWDTFNVTPATGKKMAAQKLLNYMVPDIETAVRSLGEPVKPIAAQ